MRAHLVHAGIGWLLTVLFVGASPCAAVGGEGEQLLETVRAAWAKRETTARTVRVRWRTEELIPKGGITLVLPALERREPLPTQDTVNKGRVEIVLAKDNGRLTFDRALWDTSAKAFQRDSTDVALRGGICTSRSKNVSITPVGNVSKTSWRAACDVLTWPVFASFRGVTSVELAADIGQFAAARIGHGADRSLWELTTARTEVKGHTRLLVDARHEYLPVRYEAFDRTGQLIRLITVMHARDAKGSWVPSSWQVSTYRNGALARRATCTTDFVEVGGEVPDSTFDIEFEPGTYVFDSTGENLKTSIVRDGKPPREVLPSERGAAFAELVATEPGELAATTGTSSSWVFLTVIGAIIAGIVTLVAFRRVRYKPTG